MQEVGTDLGIHPVTPEAQNMGLWLQRFYDSTEKLPADFMLDRVDLPVEEWATE